MTDDIYSQFNYILQQYQSVDNVESINEMNENDTNTITYDTTTESNDTIETPDKSTTSTEPITFTPRYIYDETKPKINIIYCTDEVVKKALLSSLKSKKYNCFVITEELITNYEYSFIHFNDSAPIDIDKFQYQITDSLCTAIVQFVRNCKSKHEKCCIIITDTYHEISIIDTLLSKINTTYSFDIYFPEVHNTTNLFNLLETKSCYVNINYELSTISKNYIEIDDEIMEDINKNESTKTKFDSKAKISFKDLCDPLTEFIMCFLSQESYEYAIRRLVGCILQSRSVNNLVIPRGYYTYLASKSISFDSIKDVMNFKFDDDYV